MYLTVKHQPKLNKNEYDTFLELCRYAKDLFNEGLYKTSNGMCINADINGALNILKKSSVVSLTALYSRGQVDSPLRIRIA